MRKWKQQEVGWKGAVSHAKPKTAPPKKINFTSHTGHLCTTHTFQSSDTRRANAGCCKGDISNMQDAGFSLKRSAFVAKGQRGFS